MKVAEHRNWLLELSRVQPGEDSDDAAFHCWLSMPVRCIVGYGKAATEEEAIREALASTPDVPADIAETLLRSALNYLKVRPYCGGRA